LKKFDLQPTLVGERICLRPLALDDFDPLFAAASDPLIWVQHPESDRYKREIFQTYFDGAMQSKGAFAIIESKSGRIIGSSRYCNLTGAGDEIEIGWTFLERAFWGGSYNRELKSLMIDHALRFVGRVVFVAGEGNTRSRRALEKIGAKFIEKVERPSGDGSNVIYVVDQSRR
jgi:RimJ/RimL family protein N-acetyltransferase